MREIPPLPFLAQPSRRLPQEGQGAGPAPPAGRGAGRAGRAGGTRGAEPPALRGPPWVGEGGGALRAGCGSRPSRRPVMGAGALAIRVSRGWEAGDGETGTGRERLRSAAGPRGAGGERLPAPSRLLSLRRAPSRGSGGKRGRPGPGAFSLS